MAKTFRSLFVVLISTFFSPSFAREKSKNPTTPCIDPTSGVTNFSSCMKYKPLCDKKISWACYQVGYGFLIPNREKAKDYFLKSCELGYSLACEAYTTVTNAEIKETNDQAQIQMFLQAKALGLIE